MATPSTPFSISKASQEKLCKYLMECYALMGASWSLRDKFLRIDKAYQREVDYTREQARAKAANRAGDTSKLQNFQVPVVMPQVEAATTYQTSVFLTGIPLFAVLSGPQDIDSAQQLETIIDDSAIRGGWTAEFIKNFRNGFKYNLAAIEVYWGRKVEAALSTDLTYSKDQAKPKEVIWEGNMLKNMDMYNTFWDVRVHPSKVHEEGEFAGYTENLSRINLKKRIAEMPDKSAQNIKEAFESGYGGQGQKYYIPPINNSETTSSIMRDGMNWLNWASLVDDSSKIQYRNMYEVVTLYARILPSDFDIRVPYANTPQIWKFIIVNSQIVIYAERQTNAHNYLPIIFSQPLDDGLGYQTKTFAENVTGVQEVSTTLMSSVLAARRRAISDRMLYDPSRVDAAHINSVNPSAKIPVRPAAQGKPLGEAVYQIPFRDDVSQEAMQQIGLLGQFADRISGQNPAKQGQFVKGNKTRTEYADVMNNANGRDQMTSILLESQMFTPIKMILKTNILQFQASGSVYSRKEGETKDIDPLALRKAVMTFKLADGLTPADKLVNADTLSVALQVLGSSPDIAAEYNKGQLFSYLMKTQGADIADFEKSKPQVAYEQAHAQWQQMVMQMIQANPKITAEQYPPEPLPANYGYNPGGTQQDQVTQAQQQPGRVEQMMQPDTSSTAQ